MPFTARIPVRFGDVDYARIVYYPRLLHLLHVAFEELFEVHVGVPYALLMARDNVGFPTVHLECEFLKPIRFGELLEVAITVPRIGTSSVDFDHAVTVSGELRAQALLTRVAVDMETLAKVPIPPALRASFAEIHPGH